MKLTCPISGIIWEAQHMQCNAMLPHPAISLITGPKIPAQLSLWQSGRLSREETHLLFLNLLIKTDHVSFHSPLMLTESTSEIENAQLVALSKLAFSGVFQKENISLPGFCISEDSQDISNIIPIWEEELEQYRISRAAIANAHEIRSMLARVQKAFSSPLGKSRKKTITDWMNRCIALPVFNTIHPISRNQIPINIYWTEILHKAIDGDSMLSYPEKDIVEFKEHLESNLPLAYAQEFSLLEELRLAISRKQNYFGFSFVDADDKSYCIDAIKPKLQRADFPDSLSYLNAIKNSRNTGNSSNN